MINGPTSGVIWGGGQKLKIAPHTFLFYIFIYNGDGVAMNLT